MITGLQHQISELRRLLAKCDLRTRPENGPPEVPADNPSGARGAVPDRRTTAGETVVRVGLILPMTGTPTSKHIAGAATLAIADINADPLLMQGRRLEYICADSGCNAITGVTAIQELLHDTRPIHGVIGGGCSSACESAAFLTAERGIPQVAFPTSLAAFAFFGC